MSQLRGGSVHELVRFGFGVDCARSRREVKAARRKRKADLLRAQKVADALLDRGREKTWDAVWDSFVDGYQNKVVLKFAVETSYGVAPPLP